MDLVVGELYTFGNKPGVTYSVVYHTDSNIASHTVLAYMNHGDLLMYMAEKDIIFRTNRAFKFNSKEEFDLNDLSRRYEIFLRLSTCAHVYIPTGCIMPRRIS